MIKTDYDMENKDRLGGYLKGLPIEKPSVDFTLQVMNRVRMEPVRAKLVYEPLISRKVWWWLFIGIALVLFSLMISFSYSPVDTSMNGLLYFEKIDLSLIISPFVLLAQALNKLPFTYIIIIAAISALLFIDQLYTRYAYR